MLTADQLDTLSDNPLLDLYQEYEQSILSDIARRLTKSGVTSTAAWQFQRLSESGAIYQNALKELSRITGRSETELALLFRKAGVKSIAFDDKIYKAAGLEPLPLNLSPVMLRVFRAELERTNGLMQNLIRTTALSAQREFLRAGDLAALQVSTGTMSYDQAIRAAVKSIGESGLPVLYPGGRADKLDVAMRRAVLTSVNQMSGGLQWARADELGQDLVQTSAHIGARPSHQLWQGKIFSRSGTHRRYPPFVESTGYGTVTGLGGANCRHSYYPYFEGISKNAYDALQVEEYGRKTIEYNGKRTSIYELSQQQRYIERQIRKWKRQRDTLSAGGLDNSAESAKVREWQGVMRNFIDQANQQKEFVWYRQRIREQI